MNRRPRTALVTGGSSGIGLATARALGRIDTVIFVGGRDRRRGAAAVDGLRGDGIDATFVLLDVRDAASVHDAFELVGSAHGGLDVLVNNAGVGCEGRIDDLSEAAWDHCLDTNLKGAFLCARAALPLMRARGGGVIINNASNAGLVARADEPAYSVAKAGLIMLTRALALGHAVDRIRVNAVCPGPVGDTGIMDRNLAAAPDPTLAAAGYLARAPLAAVMQRMITPDEVAGMIAYLCSDAAQMITGAIVAVDAGKSAAAAS